MESKTSQELEDELQQLRQQQSLLRKAIKTPEPESIEATEPEKELLRGRVVGSVEYRQNLDHLGDEPEAIAQPLEVAPSEGIIGKAFRMVDTGEVRTVTSENEGFVIYTGADGEKGVRRGTWKRLLEQGHMVPVDGSDQVGASLTEHLAEQRPQEWTPELLRNDVPAYVASEDRDGWLPIKLGSLYVWQRQDKAIVKVLEVEGPAPESLVKIKVPGTVATQNWTVADFGEGKRFAPLPELAGSFVIGPSKVTTKIFEVDDEGRVLCLDEGAAEPEWDDLSPLLILLAEGTVRKATEDEVNAWHASFITGDLDESDEQDRPELAPEEDEDCPVDDPGCESRSDERHDACERPETTADDSERGGLEERAFARVTPEACEVEPEQPRRRGRKPKVEQPTDAPESYLDVLARDAAEVEAIDAKIAELERLKTQIAERQASTMQAIRDRRAAEDALLARLGLAG